MKKKLVLHIGAVKTGSSVIQCFIQRNLALLRKQGFVIPDRRLGLSDDITGEHVFALQEFFGAKRHEDFSRTLFSLLDMIEDNQTLLLSAENISNLGNHQFFADVCAKVDVRVILYIRRQDELLISAWQQWHSKVERDFNAWIVLALLKYGQWQRLTKDWESILGTNKMTVRVYQPDEFPNGNLLKDFTKALGLDSSSAKVNFEIGNINPSYSDIITPLVAGNQAIFRDAHDSAFYKLVDVLTKTNYVGGEKISIMTKEQRDKIVEFYRPINEAVCRQYFPDRERLFKSVDHREYRYINSADLVEEQLRFLAEMIFAISKK